MQVAGSITNKICIKQIKLKRGKGRTVCLRSEAWFRWHWDLVIIYCVLNRGPFMFSSILIHNDRLCVFFLTQLAERWSLKWPVISMYTPGSCEIYVLGILYITFNSGSSVEPMTRDDEEWRGFPLDCHCTWWYALVTVGFHLTAQSLQSYEYPVLSVLLSPTETFFSYLPDWNDRQGRRYTKEKQRKNKIFTSYKKEMTDWRISTYLKLIVKTHNRKWTHDITILVEREKDTDRKLNLTVSALVCCEGTRTLIGKDKYGQDGGMEYPCNRMAPNSLE